MVKGMIKKKIHVVVGLSGGVDSSVAAYMLKEQGYEVTGLFMKNWHDTTGVLKSDCPWLDDKFDAEAVARKLDIPFHVVDLSDTYRERVVNYMFNEYARGRTPNPDVLCNREIKFDAFLNEALKLGASSVATGHYCRRDEQVIDGKPVYRLLAGLDSSKDQSYFLCQLSQQQLSMALFPVGELQKTEVRAIAAKLKLVTAFKRDSQGICFVGKVDLPVFLKQKLSSKPGDVFLIPPECSLFDRSWYLNQQNLGNDHLAKLASGFPFSPGHGKKIGSHDGAHFYTIGQRKGLNIGGFPEPLFVIGIDTVLNNVYVGMGQDHPGLFRPALKIEADELHWVRPDLALETGHSRECLVRVRYRQPLQQATICQRSEGLYIIFKELQRGITEGQFAAIYNGDELVGSGVISG